MKFDKARVWTSNDLFKVYKDHEDTLSSKYALVRKLSELLDRELIVLSAVGIASIIAFRDRVCEILHVVEDDEEDVSIQKVGKQIFQETKKLAPDKSSYNTRISRMSAAPDISSTCKKLLASVSEKLDSTLPSLLIGNIITGIINNQPTSHQIALGVLIREKKKLELLSNYGITCTYQEVRRFKSSAAAAAAAKECSLQGLTESNSGLVQVVVDNFDDTISSQNGLKSTHALAMLLTQPDFKGSDSQPCKICRLKHYEITEEITPDLQIQSYTGPKKPSMPINQIKHCVPPLKIFAQQSIRHARASNLDFQFLKTNVTDPNTPEVSILSLCVNTTRLPIQLPMLCTHH